MKRKNLQLSMCFSALLLPGLLGAGAASGPSSSRTTPVAPPASVTLEQVRNGTPGSPVTPGNWQNGNLGASQSHYLEGHSAPYRVVMTNLPTGTPITLTIGYDIRNSGKHALDYLTHYNRLEPHTFGPHNTAEEINPTLGVSGILGSPSTLPIPAPSSAGSPIPVPLPGQPTKSFNELPASERMMALWNGTITNIVYTTQGSLTANQSETQITVTFTVDWPTAVLAWGGHIASAEVWGPGNAAGGISGSPYHMRLIGWNLGNLGNQDRSLSAGAVCAVPNAADLLPQTVCKGTSATFTTTASGTGTLTYQWTLDGISIGTNAPSVTIPTSALEAKPYDVCVKVTSNSDCGVEGETVCTKLTVVEVAATAVATSASCFGGNGAVNLTVSGGTTPYTFAWSNSATTEDLASVPAGTYTVTVTDANGCTATATATVTAPPQLLASAAATNALCFGGNGAVNLTVSGGTTPYTFAWSNSATTEDLAGVPAGTYTVTVTDANGCTATASATVGQPAELSLSLEKTDVTCHGANNGTITATIGGGTGSYLINLDGGAFVPAASSHTFVNVAAGQHIVTVKNGTFATATSPYTFMNVGPSSHTVTVKNWPLATATTPRTLVNDGPGSHQVTVKNGSFTTATSPRTFVNDGPDSQTVTVKNQALAKATSPHTFQNAGTGSHTVTPTNGDECSKSALITIFQPNALASTETHQNVTCNGGNNGAINLTVSGGTSPYTFAWSNGATTEDISGVAAGTYTVTVTDAKACKTNRSVTITQPAPITCTLSPPSQLPVCGSSGNKLSAAAGFTNYEWSLDPVALAAGWSITDGQGTNTITYTAGGSGPATFSVTVTDATSCPGTCETSFSCTPNLCEAKYAYCLSDEDPEQLTRIRMDVTPPVKTVVVNRIIYRGSAYAGRPPLAGFELGKPIGSDTEAMARNGNTGTTYIISNTKDVSALFKLNLQTGNAYSVGYTRTSSGVGIFDINALAFNDQTNVLYGIDDHNDRLLRIDTTTASVIVSQLKITSGDPDLECASFDHSVPQAQLYVLCQDNNGQIFNVNTSNGVGTPVGHTIEGMETIEFSKDGRLFACNHAGSLYQINRTTYVASVFALIPELDGEGLVFDECSRVLSNSMIASDEQSETKQAEDLAPVPKDFALHQNYPNPFNPTTRLQFDLPEAGVVRIAIYDLAGNLVRTVVAGEYAAGQHHITWDATDEQGMKVGSGIYFCRFESNHFVAVRKMVLAK